MLIIHSINTAFMNRYYAVYKGHVYTCTIIHKLYGHESRNMTLTHKTKRYVWLVDLLQPH